MVWCLLLPAALVTGALLAIGLLPVPAAAPLGQVAAGGSAALPEPGHAPGAGGPLAGGGLVLLCCSGAPDRRVLRTERELVERSAGREERTPPRPP